MIQYYIYLTTNLINGKQYIGQHKGKINDSYLGSGKDIIQAIQKYGKQNFSKEILKVCESREDADFWEKYYIDLYDAVNNKNFYNLQEGGTGGDGWRACQKWFTEHPEEAKQIYQKNIERLKEWRKNNPEKFQQLVVQPMLDASHQWQKDHPDEVAKIMKKVNKAKEEWQYAHPEQHKIQVDAWRKSGSDANSQKVICLTTGEIFSSQSEAARFYNIPQANISKNLRGERKSAGKHPITKEKMIWQLYKEE